MLSFESTESNETFTSSSENIWGPRRSSLLVVLPITVTYIVIFILGFFGNVITCIVIIRNKYMHTVTNYYLLSLAVSDLLLLITGLPSEMYQIWYRYPYIFGEVFCILQGLAAETSANATVLTITAFTIERYVAICYPFFSHTATKLRRAIRYVLFIWILSFMFAIVQAMQLGLVYGRDEHEIIIEELSVCGLKNNFIPHSFEISMLLFFVAPMSVITVLYILIGMKLYKPRIASSDKRKPMLISTTNGDVNQLIVHPDPSSYVTHSKSTKRVVKMLVAVVVAFFICWAPFQTQRLLAVYGYTGNTTSSTMFMIYEIVTYVSGILYYFSTVINPILYNIMSNKFRRAFHDTITSCFQTTSIKERRNSGEIGSSGPQRLHFETTKHNNSVCSKNSCSVNNATEMLITDFSQRPIVFSFRKFTNQNSTNFLNHCNTNLCRSMLKVDEPFELNKNSYSGSLPGMLTPKDRSSGVILYPNCKCSFSQKRCAVYQTGSTFYSE